MKINLLRASRLICIYICLGLLSNTALATTETSETKRDNNDETLNLKKRDVDNYGLYGDLDNDIDKREDEQVNNIAGEFADDSDDLGLDNDFYNELETENSEFKDDDSKTEAFDDNSEKDKRYRYYGFEGQLGKRGGPMGFFTQLGKREFGYFHRPSPVDLVEEREQRSPMGFMAQLGKRGGPMGFYSQLGKRSAPMGFYSQLGKRSPMGFYSQLGKRSPMGFYSQLGKRSPMGFMSQLGKRAPMGFMTQLGKRGGPMGFFSQLGKRAPMGFMSQLGKRAQLDKRYPMGLVSQLGRKRTPLAFLKRYPMGFYAQLGKRGGPMGFMSQLGKRSDLEDMEIDSELSGAALESLSRRKRSARAIPWEAIRQRLALNSYFHPYNRFGFRGRMGKRYPGYSFFSQLG